MPGKVPDSQGLVLQQGFAYQLLLSLVGASVSERCTLLFLEERKVGVGIEHPPAPDHRFMKIVSRYALDDLLHLPGLKELSH